MAYSLKADILNQMSDEELAQLTSEQGDFVDDLVITAAIADADSLIDSYVGRQYVVPVSPTPARLKNISAMIAVYNLHSRRSAKLGGVNEAIRTNYEDCISYLKDISVGKAVLDGAVTPARSPSEAGGSFSANERVFNKDSLDGL